MKTKTQPKSYYAKTWAEFVAGDQTLTKFMTQHGTTFETWGRWAEKHGVVTRDEAKRIAAQKKSDKRKKAIYTTNGSPTCQRCYIKIYDTLGDWIKLFTGFVADGREWLCLDWPELKNYDGYCKECKRAKTT